MFIFATSADVDDDDENCRTMTETPADMARHLNVHVLFAGVFFMLLLMSHQGHIVLTQGNKTHAAVSALRLGQRTVNKLRCLV